MRQKNRMYQKQSACATNKPLMSTTNYLCKTRQSLLPSCYRLLRRTCELKRKRLHRVGGSLPGPNSPGRHGAEQKTLGVWREVSYAIGKTELTLIGCPQTTI